MVLSLADYGGTMLAATYGDGIFAVSADGSSHLVYASTLGNLKTNYVYSLLTDSHGELWIGCLDGPLVASLPLAARNTLSKRCSAS